MQAAVTSGRWRTTRLLIRLRLLRLVNGLSSRLRQPLAAKRGPKGGARGGAKEGARKATAGKQRNAWIITLFVMTMLLFSAFSLSSRALHTMVATEDHSYLSRPVGATLDEYDREDDESLQRVCANEWSLLILAALMMALANRDIVAGDTEIEWLSSLPVTNQTLMFARICERSVLNGPALVLIWPATVCLGHLAHLGVIASAALGLLAVAPVMMFCAALRTLFETAMRLLAGPPALRNLQALLGVGSVVLLYIAITPAMPAGAAMIALLSRIVVPFEPWLPGHLLVGTMGLIEPTERLEQLGVLWLEALVISGFCLGAINLLMRRGLVTSGVRESGRQDRLTSTTSSGDRFSDGIWTRLIPPLQRRELTLLARDRNFLIRTLVLPAVILIGNRLMNSGVQGLGVFSRNETLAASTAFGLAAYCMILSALQTLILEGKGLWLAYSFPIQIEDFLKEKARLWAVLTLIYPIGLYAYAFTRGLHLDARGFGMAAKVLLGVPIFSFIATALGVFACDPLTEETAAKTRITYVYLFMLLAGVYIYAISAASQWQSLVMIALLAMFSQALWQKARDDLPYLLDPTALPAPRIATADGLIAALLFFVMQILSFFLLQSSDAFSDGAAVLLSYSIGGAITYLFARLSYWRAKTIDMPVIFRGMHLRYALMGVALGLAVAVFAIGYLLVIERLGIRQKFDGRVLRRDLLWMLPLAAIAAPLFEEFIFRGLVFGGLRRSQTRWFAVLGSAALFAVLHSPQSMLPVFVFGIGAALLYERSRALLSSMIAHAVYNTTMVLVTVFGLPFVI